MIPAIALATVHLILNVLLTREIVLWIVQRREKFLYILLLWALPVVGVIVAWRRVKPEWFSGEPGDRRDRGTVSSGLLALDAIFNPGSAHVADVQKRSEVTIRMEGEMYDRELPDHIKIGDNAPTPEDKD